MSGGATSCTRALLRWKAQSRPALGAVRCCVLLTSEGLARPRVLVGHEATTQYFGGNGNCFLTHLYASILRPRPCHRPPPSLAPRALPLPPVWPRPPLLGVMGSRSRRRTVSWPPSQRPLASQPLCCRCRYAGRNAHLRFRQPFAILCHDPPRTMAQARKPSRPNPWVPRMAAGCTDARTAVACVHSTNEVHRVDHTAEFARCFLPPSSMCLEWYLGILLRF